MAEKKSSSTDKKKVVEENEKDSVVKNIASDVKDEAASTFKTVKKTMKTGNPKADVKKTTKHVTSLFKDPIGTFYSIANSKRNGSLKVAIFILIFWTLLNLVHVVGNMQWAWNVVFKNILGILGGLLKPLCSILIISILTYLYDNKNDRDLSKTISVFAFTQVPVVIGSIVTLLDLISPTAHYVTEFVNTYCTLIGLVFTYFGIRALLNNEDDKEVLKNYAMIQALYFIICIVLGFAGVSLYLL